MRTLDIQGVRRGRRVRTTRADSSAVRHPDLVQRVFTATRPNELWVTDLTYVATWSGMAYVCLIVDAFSRRIVGWRVASHMRTDMVLDAVEMARWQRGGRLDSITARTGPSDTNRAATGATPHQSAPPPTRPPSPPHPPPTHEHQADAVTDPAQRAT
jgi:transposase InsO family protein